MTYQKFEIDPVHATFDHIEEHQMLIDVRKDKYCQQGEESLKQLSERVSQAVFGSEAKDKRELLFDALSKRLFIPAGRIWAGIGTGNKVTLMNCYVMDTIPDTLEGIMRVLAESSFTMKQGGGIGMDFSTIRPDGAFVRGVNAPASGPLPFMDLWNAMCLTIMSAGSRRGAMMAVMDCSHPDIEKFIEAKRVKGRLTQFNVSVLVTDEFMKAVQVDESWSLVHTAPPAESEDTPKMIGNKYVYKTVRARDLWNKIVRSAYEYAEPGVIFIDRINDNNNLKYCEEIRATNPCGEQPLPPYGACNLGSINLSRIVKHPFTRKAHIDFHMLDRLVTLAVETLDRIIDITEYPLHSQKEEQQKTRRIGLGILGLADMFAQLGIRYGSKESQKLVDSLMNFIKTTAYETSRELAEKLGAFPAFNSKYLEGEFIQGLPKSTIGRIQNSGIRNALLLSIAPTGTISLGIAGNTSSGCEPIFAHIQDRNVLQPDGTLKKYKRVPGYTQALLNILYIENDFEVMKDLTVDDHLAILESLQPHVDSSISKTINMPAETSFKDFEGVYSKAWISGLKGCTVYRPSDTRGVIISDSDEKPKVSETPKMSEFIPVTEPGARPDIMVGCTYKIKWPSWNSAIYITINENEDGESQEVFIHSKDARYQEWTTAMSVLISAIMKRVEDPRFIARELIQLQSTHDTAWVDGKHYGSLVAMIGTVILKHIEGLGYLDTHTKNTSESEKKVEVAKSVSHTTKSTQTFSVAGKICPKCQAPTLIMMDGCESCESCDYTKCG